MARQEGWAVDIVTTDPVFQDAVARAGLGVVALGGIERAIRPWTDLQGLWRLWRLLRARRYCIVHTHTSKGGFLGRLAATLAGVPVVIHTAHGFAIHEASPFWEKYAYVALERLASCWCDAIVCVSRFHRDWGARIGLAPARKLRAVPNGIPPERVAPSLSVSEARVSLGIAGGICAILCPSRLAPQKGIEDLLRAAAILDPEFAKRVHFYFAGEGPAEDQYKRLAAELGLDGLVTFLGFRTDVPDLLAAADLVVLPSIREGLSISLLEAMAAGKPIIATSIGSNREAGAALLVPPQDPARLAEAIQSVIEHPALAAQLGRQAGVKFRDSYTEQTMIQDYRRIYMQLLSEKGVLAPSASAAGRQSRWTAGKEKTL
jgi:glycosyltransferase involved in cell wall biosynthesis